MKFSDEEIEKKFNKAISEGEIDEKTIGWLYIENFGPLEHININIKKLSIFTGYNNAGKTVLSRLLSILFSIEIYLENNNEKIKNFFIESEINFFQKDTCIFFSGGYGSVKFAGDSFFQIKKNEHFSEEKLLETIKKIRAGATLYPKTEKAIDLIDKKGVKKGKENEAKETLNMINQHKPTLESAYHIFKMLKTIYIPSERAFISLVSSSLYSLLSAKIPISEPLISFGSDYETSRNNLKGKKLEFLGVKYKYKNNEDRVYFSNENYHLLSAAASGVQSALPLYLILNNIKNDEFFNIIVEEPETNLFPLEQKKLVDYMASCFSAKEDVSQNMMITTHSPYILSAFDNLVQAANTAKKSDKAKAEVQKIIPSESWIDIDNLAAYFISDGKAVDIVDREEAILSSEFIDSVSDIIGEEYDSLLDIKA